MAYAPSCLYTHLVAAAQLAIPRFVFQPVRAHRQRKDRQHVERDRREVAVEPAEVGVHLPEGLDMR